MLNIKKHFEFTLKVLLIVVRKDIFSARQKSLYLGIGLGHKLDNERTADLAEETCHFAKGQVVGDGKMMNKG